MAEKRGKLEESTLRAKKFEESYDELDTLCGNPTIAELDAMDITKVDSEAVESCLAEFEV